MLAFGLFVLFHTVLSIIFLCVVLFKCYQMFSDKNLRNNATPVLLLFFVYLTIVSLTSLGYAIYLLALWRPYEIIYRNISMYLTGIIPWILLVSNPIFELSLCIERCFLITHPHKYYHHWKRYMCFAVFVTTIFTVVINLYINDFIRLPPSGLTECQYFACIINNLPIKYMTSYKILISLAEIFAAMVLLYFVKFRTISINSKAKKKNIVIFAVIISTVIFEFGPNILDILFYNLSGQLAENVIGPYRTTLSSFNISISAVLYSYVLKPKNTVGSLPIFVTTSAR